MSNYEAAARAISESSFLLVCAGAGFSADSGLPVYKDVAEFEAYKKLGMDYAKLCDPGLLQDRPDLFYGFWGLCFNQYRDTAHHAGYAILDKWKSKYFNRKPETSTSSTSQVSATIDVLSHFPSKLAEFGGMIEESGDTFLVTNEIVHLRGKRAKAEQKKTAMTRENEKLLSESELNEFEARASERKRCFVTSARKTLNVMPSSSEPFATEAEPHSATPLPSRFFVLTSNVDSHFRRVFEKQEVHELHGSCEGVQCSRQCTKEVWKLPADHRFKIDMETMTCSDGFPPCPNCKELTRPNVCMFSDWTWVTDAPAANSYHVWKAALEWCILHDPSRKIVILEMGCGTRVPSLRIEGENLLRNAPKGQCTHIRVNMDFPEASRTTDNTISIQDGALSALMKIDAILEKAS